MSATTLGSKKKQTVPHIILSLAIVSLAILASNGSAFGQSAPTINDRFAQLNNSVPGFGGLYVDPDKDTLYVLMVSGHDMAPVQFQQALTDAFGPDVPRQGKTVVLPAQYSFAQLKGWQDYSESEIFSIRDVASMSIHLASNRIEIGVANRKARAAVEARLTALGIPLDAVEFIQEGTPVLDSNKECTSVQSKCRPLVGGLQIQSDKRMNISTLGFNATRAGVDGFVTCGHCGNENYKNVGTIYYQNVKADANRIGTEIANPPLVANLQHGGSKCPEGSLCRLSDSSFAQYQGGPEVKVGFIAHPQLDKIDWNGTDYFRIIGYQELFANNHVAKVGRTTGFTQGAIIRTCVDVVFPKKDKDDKNLVLLCQNLADYKADSGDSGAPVFLCQMASKPCNQAESDAVFLLGIHAGRAPFKEKGKDVTYSYYSDIGLIMEPRTELGPLTKFCDPAAKNPNCS
jgi:hypothetical protein